MRLIDEILSDSNIDRAILQVKRNKGVSGVDKMTVDELDEYFYKHRREIRYSILNKKYKPQSVKRVYIPKPNGKKRPLGIPTVVDRVIQQAVAQVLMKKLDSSFSEFSYGFRPRRSAQMAVLKTLEYINEGYDWVIDLDIEAYFDTVNHDKLISILREKNVNDSTTLHLIRKFMQAGIMEDGLVKPSRIGVPQGGLCRYPHKPPCGVPFSGTPSPSISAFSILLIMQISLLSRMPSVQICFNNFPWLTLSKNPLISTSTQ